MKQKLKPETWVGIFLIAVNPLDVFKRSKKGDEHA